MPTRPRRRSEGGLPRYKLTVGELFSADDLVAQWVFSLTSVAEDLTILTPLLNRDDMRERMWFYRPLITRLLEARRPAYARPSVHERSAVEKVYADSRNRTVHYSKVGEPELRGVLHDYRWLPARMVTPSGGEDGGRPQIEYQWVTGIRSQDVWGTEPWASGMAEHLHPFGQRTRALSSSWVMLSFVLLALHARRLGIALERVVDNPGRIEVAVRVARERSDSAPSQ